MVLFLIYYFVPNGRPPLNRVIAAAIGVGVLMEVLKYINRLVWPWFQRKLETEYHVFQYSVTLIFLGFLASMLVLAGAEWAARGHRSNRKLKGEEMPERPAGGDHRRIQRDRRHVRAQAGGAGLRSAADCAARGPAAVAGRRTGGDISCRRRTLWWPIWPIRRRSGARGRERFRAADLGLAGEQRRIRNARLIFSNRTSRAGARCIGCMCWRPCG